MAKNHHESVVRAMCDDIIGYFLPLLVGAMNPWKDWR